MMAIPKKTVEMMIDLVKRPAFDFYFANHCCVEGKFLEIINPKKSARAVNGRGLMVL